MAATDDSSRLRRKDTTKGPPLRVLSLDGGGVRGFSIFIILQELMHRTFVEMRGRAPKPDEIPKPCDHFDLIGGTGTGGLIAIMLGRLRMDIETCKDVYTRMTRRVFQTDKTIVGIPYKSTLYKASKLEEAIRDCVREHTIYEDEGNDVLSSAVPMTPDVIGTAPMTPDSVPQRSMSQSSRYSQIGRSPSTPRASLNYGSTRWGNPNALLYDTRENRTKTAVTAIFRGTRGAESTVMLRSYDSRKEPAPDVNCMIWQAGRATSAIGLAFKPIQIGQYVYHDDGTGEFNPAPSMLDEAVQNEWPGREIGVFVSVGTGKRPDSSDTANNQAEWWEGFMGSTMGSFAEARRRLIMKIEGCEDTHNYMLQRHLAVRGVNPDNYYRLNVEVGIGEFGINEYERLSDISTNTRMYLSRSEVQAMSTGAAAKLAKTHLAEIRQQRAEARQNLEGGQQASQHNRWDLPQSRTPPLFNPPAVELPGDELFGFASAPSYPYHRGQYEHRPSIADQKYTVIAEDVTTGAENSGQDVEANQTAAQPLYHGSRHTASPPRSSHDAQRVGVPPLPPKLPYPSAQHPAERPPGRIHYSSTGLPLSTNDIGRIPPYPDLDGPPPAVNTANKPTRR